LVQYAKQVYGGFGLGGGELTRDCGGGGRVDRDLLRWIIAFALVNAREIRKVLTHSTDNFLCRVEYLLFLATYLE
jgi:hypothetical protein